MNLMLYSNFLSHLTLKKIQNLLKITISYYISNILKRPIRWGMPISISIEPTNFCNLKCPQCPVGLNILTRNKGFMKLENFKKIIDQTKDYLMNLFIYFQGEPLLHKEITNFIKYANQNNIFTAIATNGQLITKDIAYKLITSGLNYIIISMDGITQKSYEKYRRNANLDILIKNIQCLTKLKKQLNSKTPFIELQFLVMKHNENEIKAFKNLAKKLKADKISFKSIQIIDFSTAHLYLPTKEKFSRYKYINHKWQLKRKLKNKCWRLWNSIVITWDGQVLPCCYDKDAKYSFGNINNYKIKELIKNDKFKKFAYKVLTNRKSIDICQNCIQ